MYEYLYAQKEKLLKRDYFRKSSKHWFELWNPRKKEHFLNKKFVFSEIGMFNDFALVNKCFYTDSACGSELKPEFSKYYNYILLYLNSDVITYIYKKISVPKANGYSIFKNAFLKELPVIIFTNDETELDKFIDMEQVEFNDYIRQQLNISEEENNLICNTLKEYSTGK